MTQSIYDYSKEATAQHSGVGIRSLPSCERPREKLMESGPGALSNAELLAILLGSGTREESAIAVAQRLLSMDSEGLLFLNKCTVEELCSLRGVGPAKASLIVAAFELGRRTSTSPRNKRIEITCPDEVAELFMEDMRYLKREELRVLMLNVRSEITGISTVSIGGIKSSEAGAREVFAAPIRKGAAAIVLAHNHPSGNPAPSDTDISLTRRLIEAGNLLDIKVLDHIIIGDGDFVSLACDNLI